MEDSVKLSLGQLEKSFRFLTLEMFPINYPVVLQCPECKQRFSDEKDFAFHQQSYHHRALTFFCRHVNMFLTTSNAHVVQGITMMDEQSFKI